MHVCTVRCAAGDQLDECAIADNYINAALAQNQSILFFLWTPHPLLTKCAAWQSVPSS